MNSGFIGESAVVSGATVSDCFQEKSADAAGVVKTDGTISKGGGRGHVVPDGIGGFRGGDARRWLLLVVLSFTAFIFNTTEFVPIGLLSDIAADFGMSEARTSLLITVYAWFVAVMSLPLMLAVGKYDFRKILLAIIGLFIVSHAVSAVSANFTMLMASRLGVACSHAIFWSIMSPLAVHIAPEGKREAALGMIITGTSLAMIVGMPMGRVIGLHLGWRVTFGCVGGAALLAFVLLALMFPPVPNKQNASVKSLPGLIKSPVLAGIYVFIFLAVLAHYTGYSYIEPFMKQVAGMSDSLTTLTLMLFGIAGVGSSVLFSRFYGRRRRAFLVFVAVGMPVVLFLMRPMTFNTYSAVGYCMVWGLLFTMFNLVTEFETIRNSPEATTVAVSIYSSIFNIGIGGGAFVGGMVVDDYSISVIGYVGGAIAVVAMLFALKRLLPALCGSPAGGE